ncbi:CHC2 zinc finger domain-containing protein [Novosphingobium mangrovi (ex Huang et al. 2023)]|uniref:CHC2 zinc finger domain-containing protein n=1 Tax=Novosphingobium mangrovi (ex Huang et al. 2023) TaxID=2976432 RepID=A0ABT2I134_9SPHN|nr:CHC2 zinc finger domain-containing protein [Novosphingobium mangrovi (ex Huang et al. 2023)]MCT2398511.1 CHC2 zinc finger domain-containing protein [Novosphingobium mangrovi (ex Huang et al. 2023)]
MSVSIRRGVLVPEAATIEQRKAEVRQRLSIGDVIGKHWKLIGSPSSARRRAQCGFHGSNSLSFSVKDADSGDGFGHCFGCGWHGDMFRFLMDLKGWPFMEALAELEREAGIVETGGDERSARGTVQRAKAPQPRRQRERQLIEPVDMGRWIWKHAVRDDRAVRRYFMGRGVPEAMLGAERLDQFRYMADCPCVSWEQGSDPRKVIHAPAVIALVREPHFLGEVPALEWVPVGVHVTYLKPDGTGTMVRRKTWAKADDKEPNLPKRRMLGPTGRGCVVLGHYHPGAKLWLGEGNETVLSGMALGKAGADDVGIATLSLDNLQGHVAKWRGGVWPLFAIRPDPERPCFRVPGHRGPVVGLVDSDMRPLKGMKDPRTGAFQGEPVVECKGGPIVRRAITGAERAQICGELIVKGWRAAGCPVEAMRAPMGMDFNDAVREAV